jgi:hypothetical protein
MTGSRDSNRSEPPGGGREADAESSGEQRHSRRNTNGQRGRMRAMSVRVNAKSHRHQKPHQVEPGGMRRKWVFLLGETSGARALGGVSRGHSSVDAGRKPGRAKGRRTAETAQSGELGPRSVESSETWRERPTNHFLPAAWSKMDRWTLSERSGRGGKDCSGWRIPDA